LYQSKLTGIYNIVTIILTISKFYQITQGMVQVICDGESALKHCFKQQTCNPTEKHFDIIHTIWSTMHETSLTWQWEHTQGHQDNAELARSNKACWNAAMDTAAKNIWKKAKITQTPPS